LLFVVVAFGAVFDAFDVSAAADFAAFDVSVAGRTRHQSGCRPAGTFISILENDIFWRAPCTSRPAP
jgi:hypothetical protein